MTTETLNHPGADVMALAAPQGEVEGNAMSLALKCALKEVTAAIVECEEARDAAARRLDRLKEQERSLQQLIRDSA